ncbi:MAG: hypothetical protein CSA62_05625 [Planctomycetota bacterium]|nr:MAG: hypothetical protein CSA62_05625 [Planctomycetota bacterium]
MRRLLTAHLLRPSARKGSQLGDDGRLRSPPSSALSVREDRPARLPIWLQLLLFAIPLLLAYLNLSDGSGHGDSAHYRRLVCLIELDGQVPLAPLEWSHPLHWLCCWLLTRVLAELGLLHDPFYVIQGSNIVALAVLALVAARTCQRLDGDRTRSALLGLAIGLLPGWAWSAQEPLSDVSGHALLGLAVCALLLLPLDRREGGSGRMAAFWASLLAASAFLFRPSAGLFLPLLLLLAIGGLKGARGQVWQLLALLLLPGALLISLLLAHYLWVHGLDGFLAVFFRPSVHNFEFGGLGAALGRITDWAHLLHRGLGSVAFLVAVVGWLLWILAGDWRRRSGPPRSVGAWMLFLLLVGIAPYFLFLLGNPAADQFRFTLPAQLGLVLGLLAFYGWGERILGRRERGLLFGVLVLSFLWQALPLLRLLATRDSFVERATQELVAEARAEDWILGTQVGPGVSFYLSCAPLLKGGWGQGQRQVSNYVLLQPKTSTEEGANEPWFESWRSVERRLLELWAAPATEPRPRVLLSNELGILPFRRWAQLRGMRERLIRKVPARELRHRFDAGLETMNILEGQLVVDLELRELLPPQVLVFREDPRRLRLRFSESLAPGSIWELWHGCYDEFSDPLGLELPLIPGLAPVACAPLPGSGEVSVALVGPKPVPGEAWAVLVRDALTGLVLARSHLWFPSAADDVSLLPDMFSFVPVTERPLPR